MQLSPEQLEFFAEDVSVKIIPNFSLSRASQGSAHCIGGDYGPFQPNFPMEVPLWLALYLHRHKKCRIEAPDWMSIDSLQGLYEQERLIAAGFQPIPYHYIEVSRLLLMFAKDSFGNSFHRTRELVEMIRKVRFNKIDSGLQILQGPMTVKLNNLSAMELNTIRPFFAGALDQFWKLAQMEEPQELSLQPSATYTQGSAEPPVRQLRRGVAA
ncbi:hypothetical protein WJX84_004805 [Apatococcus fuscideae]|uniref:DNA replication complex GINS protein PSF2 n=1 Tax=Apatococcus fuscideae TaxID=2026836 RepID=A0AAW1T658_9CHLO